jgi:hypothetical protein
VAELEQIFEQLVDRVPLQGSRRRCFEQSQLLPLRGAHCGFEVLAFVVALELADVFVLWPAPDTDYYENRLYSAGPIAAAPSA